MSDNVRHMTEKEKKDLDDLYLYIKDVLGLGKNENLTREQMVRLNGIHRGLYMGNNNIFDRANIDYDVILMTLRLYRNDIERGFSKNSFSNDMHKFNYMCKIIESHLSDTFKLIKAHKYAEEKVNTNHVEESTSAEYRTARDTEGYKLTHKIKETTDESLWGDL